MTTDREARKAATTEFRQLKLGWDELFNTAPDEVVELMVEEDAMHPPIALHSMLRAMLHEHGEAINEWVGQAVGRGEFELGTPEHFQFVVERFGMLTTLVGVRMFRFGQHMSARLPYDNMVPCMCKVTTDDEIAKLLSQHMDLEGNGFVIRDFYKDEEKD